jgi:hypothetical protein
MKCNSVQPVGGFCLFTLFALLIVLAPRGAIAETIPIPGYTLVETIIVPSDCVTSVVSVTTLADGVTYKLKASGTVVIGGPSPETADAEYLTFGPSDFCIFGGAEACDYGIAINDSVVGGEKFPFWGIFNPDHEYTIDFVGLDAPISLNFHDDFCSDNSGSLTVEIFQPAEDSDGDGIPDNEDECPNSDLSTTVIIDGCNTGVPNTLFPSGCTISDLIVECAEGASNHGQFASCVSHVTNDLKKAGTITGQQKGAIQSCAAQADIP